MRKENDKLLRGTKTNNNSNNLNNNNNIKTVTTNNINAKGNYHPISNKKTRPMKSWQNAKSMISHMPALPTKSPTTRKSFSLINHNRYHAFSDHTNRRLDSLWGMLGLPIVAVASKDLFGKLVSLSADRKTVAAGAGWNDDNGSDSGHARIFTYFSTSNSWLQVGDAIVGAASGDLFGASVSLSANRKNVAAGATSYDKNGSKSSHVRIFTYSSTSNAWLPVGNAIVGAASYDWFREAVSISADRKTVAAGASWNDNNGIDSGYARTFKYSSTSNKWL